MIGIIGAMEEEVQSLIDFMDVKEKKEISSMVFYKGRLGKKEVVVVQSGIGKVNMAVCTQILVDIYHVNQLINTGIAGGLYQDINIGDIVISSDTLQHDMDATGFGYKLGEIPRMESSIFQADEELVKLAKEVCEEVNPDIQCFIGRVVSGDQFISSSEKKKELIDVFQGYCAEMEGAAMAQVAYLNKIPFVILRAISDKADNSATEDYPAFEKKAIKHILRLVRGILDRE
ncbi:MAG: 5'-methylthioadenosine/adenosylhomocysteine nucleosidase [Anaerostipes sp.]|nr:5'-methylthioadenosine/adenosylhomocysteine nucleosidase [Anaerostipes sp.]